MCRLRVHPKEHHIFACGGKERELSVWDVNAYKEGICFMETRKEKESKGKEKADPEEEEAIDAIFNAKVVYSDL